MSSTTISIRRYMTYECYNKQQMVEMNLKLIISKNPHLINTLDKNIIHPLLGKMVIFLLVSNEGMC